MTLTSPLIVIIEPNVRVLTPYSELSSAYSILRLSATEQAIELMKTTTPALVMISTSYSMIKILEVLHQIKHVTTKEIIPVIFVVDWSNRLSTVPGTTWAGKVGLLHSLSSAKQVEAEIERLTTEVVT